MISTPFLLFDPRVDPLGTLPFRVSIAHRGQRSFAPCLQQCYFSRSSLQAHALTPICRGDNTQHRSQPQFRSSPLSIPVWHVQRCWLVILTWPLSRRIHSQQETNTAFHDTRKKRRKKTNERTHARTKKMNEQVLPSAEHIVTLILLPFSQHSALELQSSLCVRKKQKHSNSKTFKNKQTKTVV